MVIINEALCIGCGACEADCLARAVRVTDGKAGVIKDCFHCGHCVAVCPAEAVRLEGDGYRMEDVIPFDPAVCRVSPEVMLNTIKCRRSIRQFEKRQVKREDVERILEAGRFSPTGSNSQNVSYLVFREQTEELRALAMEEFRKLEGDEEAFAQIFPPPMSLSRVDFSDDDFLFKGAPAVIVTVSPHMVNAAVASANMELMAVSLGVGVVYIGFFVRLAAKNERIRAFLGLGPQDQAVTCLSLGYPNVSYRRSVPRKPARVQWR
ncbi:MAG: 4Fe-4S dicluster domain-containing protein [Lachnospiraceae bacterium]|nr:4Fe-4S dicluster domain-containing protein [Lachnospiraceae bacterium]